MSKTNFYSPTPSSLHPRATPAGHMLLASVTGWSSPERVWEDVNAASGLLLPGTKVLTPTYHHVAVDELLNVSKSQSLQL